MQYLKDEVVKNYGHQGQEVVDKNFAAIDAAAECLEEINTEALLESKFEESEKRTLVKTGSEELDHFVNHIMEPMNRQKGDDIPVSAFTGIEDGTFPLGTTQYEKRGIALYIPEWKPDHCVQCNQCALVCPHAVLRPFLITGQELEHAPEKLQQKARSANGKDGKYFYMAVSAMVVQAAETA